MHTTHLHTSIFMLATAKMVMGSGRQNTVSKLKLKNSCTGSTHNTLSHSFNNLFHSLKLNCFIAVHCLNSLKLQSQLQQQTALRKAAPLLNICRHRFPNITKRKLKIFLKYMQCLYGHLRKGNIFK